MKEAARKSVLITGASSGLGLETALYLASHDYHVYASVPHPSHMEAVATAAKSRDVHVRLLVLDVTDPIGIQSAVETMVKECGGIYGVVNNAGIGLRGFFEDLSDKEIRQLFDVNVLGVMAVTRAVLPYMRIARKGRIVIIGSAGGRIASMTISAYCAGKFAVEGFGEALALETSLLGLHVSLIEPGLVMTPHFTVNRGRAKAALNPQSPYYAWFVQHEEMVDNIIKKNRITPTDVAKTVKKALEQNRPRLRYVVGWRARLLISFRKHLPGELFDRIYFRELKRRIARTGVPVPSPSEPSLPG